MGGYIERAAMLEKGRDSKYINLIIDNSRDILDEEQCALLALIAEKAEETQDCIDMDLFIPALVKHTVYAQRLMPAGTIRSKQILVSFAIDVLMGLP